MSIEELILATVKEYNFPVCFDFPAGHIIDNNVLVFGREVNLEVSSDEVIVDFFV